MAASRRHLLCWLLVSSVLVDTCLGARFAEEDERVFYREDGDEVLVQYREDNEPAYDCSDDPVEWPTWNGTQQAWCCEHEGRGCKADDVEEGRNISVEAGQCVSGTHMMKDPKEMRAQGWKLQFDAQNTLGGSFKCSTSSWHAYKSGTAVGTAEYVFSFDGKVRLVYGNCWHEGKVIVYLNGKEIGSADRLTSSEVVSFDVKNDDKLEVKDEEGNAVVQLVSMEIKCSDDEGDNGSFSNITTPDSPSDTDQDPNKTRSVQPRRHRVLARVGPPHEPLDRVWERSVPERRSVRSTIHIRTDDEDYDTHVDRGHDGTRPQHVGDADAEATKAIVAVMNLHKIRASQEGDLVKRQMTDMHLKAIEELAHTFRDAATEVAKPSSVGVAAAANPLQALFPQVDGVTDPMSAIKLKRAVLSALRTAQRKAHRGGKGRVAEYYDYAYYYDDLANMLSSPKAATAPYAYALSPTPLSAPVAPSMPASMPSSRPAVAAAPSLLPGVLAEVAQSNRQAVAEQQQQQQQQQPQYGVQQIHTPAAPTAALAEEHGVDEAQQRAEEVRRIDRRMVQAIDTAVGLSRNPLPAGFAENAGPVVPADLSNRQAGWDCQDGLLDWEMGWSDAKQDWCCQHKGLACPLSS